MLGSERKRLNADAIRELQALDAALRGEPVEEQHASTVELVRAMRAVKPAPSERAALALDTRVAHAFERKPRRASRLRARTGRPPRAAEAESRGAGHRRSWPRTVFSHPGWVAGVLAGLALAVAVPLTLTGATRPPSGEATSARAPATSAPATSAPAMSAPATRAPSRVLAPAPFAPQAAPAAPAQRARRVERTATLDVGVASSAIQSTAQRVFALASAFHGYVQQSSVSTGGKPTGPPVQVERGEGGDQGEQGGASFQLRLPSSSLGAALATLAQLGHVRSETDTTNDVTGQVDGLERSVHDAQAQRASLIAQLARAASAESEEALKRQLRAVERRISGLRQALGAVKDRIQYTNVALSLTPEAHRSEGGGYLTVGGALHDGGRILAAALAVLVLVGTALLPVALMGLAGWALVSATRRRMREQALDES